MAVIKSNVGSHRPWWQQAMNTSAWKGKNAFDALAARTQDKYGSQVMPAQEHYALQEQKNRWDSMSLKQQNTVHVPGWETSGLQRGGRIGSAAGAINSRGTPTSARGRAERQERIIQEQQRQEQLRRQQQQQQQQQQPPTPQKGQEPPAPGSEPPSEGPSMAGNLQQGATAWKPKIAKPRKPKPKPIHEDMNAWPVNMA